MGNQMECCCARDKEKINDFFNNKSASKELLDDDRSIFNVIVPNRELNNDDEELISLPSEASGKLTKKKTDISTTISKSTKNDEMSFVQTPTNTKKEKIKLKNKIKNKEKSDVDNLDKITDFKTLIKKSEKSLKKNKKQFLNINIENIQINIENFNFITLSKSVVLNLIINLDDKVISSVPLSLELEEEKKSKLKIKPKIKIPKENEISIKPLECKTSKNIKVSYNKVIELTEEQKKNSKIFFYLKISDNIHIASSQIISLKYLISNPIQKLSLHMSKLQQDIGIMTLGLFIKKENEDKEIDFIKYNDLDSFAHDYLTDKEVKLYKNLFTNIDEEEISLVSIISSKNDSLLYTCLFKNIALIKQNNVQFIVDVIFSYNEIEQLINSNISHRLLSEVLFLYLPQCLVKKNIKQIKIISEIALKNIKILSGSFKENKIEIEPTLINYYSIILLILKPKIQKELQIQSLIETMLNILESDRANNKEYSVNQLLLISLQLFSVILSNTSTYSDKSSTLLSFSISILNQFHFTPIVMFYCLSIIKDIIKKSKIGSKQVLFINEKMNINNYFTSIFPPYKGKTESMFYYINLYHLSIIEKITKTISQSEKVKTEQQLKDILLLSAKELSSFYDIKINQNLENFTEIKKTNLEIHFYIVSIGSNVTILPETGEILLQNLLYKDVFTFLTHFLDKKYVNDLEEKSQYIIPIIRSSVKMLKNLLFEGKESFVNQLSDYIQKKLGCDLKQVLGLIKECVEGIKDITSMDNDAVNQKYLTEIKDIIEEISKSIVEEEEEEEVEIEEEVEEEEENEDENK